MSGLRWTGKVFPPYKVATLLSERNQKKGDLERKWSAMDGRRVSSLSVGSNESEGSGGTRVGEIYF